MKIFIEGSALFANNKSGVGQYTKRLTEALLDEIKPNDSVYVYGFMPLRRSTRKQMMAIRDPRLKYKIIPLPAIVYNFCLKILHIHLPIDLLMIQKPDVILFPNYFVHPTITKVKKAVVIHDLGYIYCPETLKPKNLFYLKKFMPYSIKKSNKIITISRSTRDQIAKNYNIHQKDIGIVNPSISHNDYYPRTKREIAKVTHKYKLKKKYILFEGTLEPRKNIVGLLKAYEALGEKIHKEYDLILVGGKGWQDEDIQAQLNRVYNLPIVRPGYVPDEDLPALFSGASLFVWPTFYEGFGMPVLEAMACGVPVITSNNSSLPEVVGNAALLIDPKNTPQISNQIIKVLGDPNLAKGLKQKGLNQAKKFSWQQSAQKLYRIFQEM